MATSMLTSKVISLREVWRQIRPVGVKVMGQSAERRIEYRQACEDRLFVQVTSCNEPDLVGVTFSCKAIDVSSGGLCISSESYVPEGAKLDLWVENSTRPGKYFLTSDVRWVEAGSNGAGCQLGIELHESPTTDIDQWRQDH